MHFLEIIKLKTRRKIPYIGMYSDPFYIQILLIITVLEKCVVTPNFLFRFQ